MGGSRTPALGRKKAGRRKPTTRRRTPRCLACLAAGVKRGGPPTGADGRSLGFHVAKRPPSTFHDLQADDPAPDGAWITRRAERFRHPGGGDFPPDRRVRPKVVKGIPGVTAPGGRGVAQSSAQPPAAAPPSGFRVPQVGRGDGTGGKARQTVPAQHGVRRCRGGRRPFRPGRRRSSAVADPTRTPIVEPCRRPPPTAQA